MILSQTKRRNQFLREISQYFYIPVITVFQAGIAEFTGARRLWLMLLSIARAITTCYTVPISTRLVTSGSTSFLSAFSSTPSTFTVIKKSAAVSPS